MARDPIIEEVYKNRDDISRRYDNDLQKLVKGIQKRQEEGRAQGKKYITLPPKKVKGEAA